MKEECDQIWPISQKNNSKAPWVGLLINQNTLKMKKLSFLVLALFVFVACQQKGPERYTNASTEIDVVKALLKDYNAGNWESWVSHYADTAKVYHNSLESTTVSEALEGLKANLAATSSYGFTDKDMFHEMVIDDDNETWVNLWATWEGTLSGNNQKLVIPVHLTTQFVNGKIVKEYAYYNLSEFVLAIQDIEAAKMAEESEDGKN